MGAPLRRRLDDAVRTLYPGYFALVMATGIVADGLQALGSERLSDALFAVNLVAFPALVAGTAVRAARHPRALWADLVDPRMVFSFFTVVAAADVLGLQLVNHGAEDVATGLWVFALVAWTLLSYFSFSVLTFRNTETGADVVHGGWLIAIVGTESLALLGTRLAPDLGAAAFVLVYVLWGIGIVLYGIFVTLFSWRIFFLRVRAADMNPLFWVIMGAAAIAANTGSRMIVTPTGLPFLESMHAFVDGTTLILWAWASWWIPLLIIVGVYRHAVCHAPLTYSPTYWSLVFPVGMYTVATYRLSLASDFTPLQSAARVLVWFAFAAWLLSALGLVRSSARALRAGA